MTIIEKCKVQLQRFAKDESGLSAVEYGLLAAGIAIGLWTILAGISGDLQGIFTSIKNDLASASSGA